MVVEIFKAPACRVGGGASKNGGEAVNFCEYWEICLKETEFKAITIFVVERSELIMLGWKCNYQPLGEDSEHIMLWCRDICIFRTAWRSLNVNVQKQWPILEVSIWCDSLNFCYQSSRRASVNIRKFSQFGICPLEEEEFLVTMYAMLIPPGSRHLLNAQNSDAQNLDFCVPGT